MKIFTPTTLLFLCFGLVHPVAKVFAEERKHVDVLRGGAWHYHVGDDGPCNAEHTNCDFVGPAIATNYTFGRELMAMAPTAALEVSSTLVNQNAAIAVTFTTSSWTPTSKDWIGVYCNEDANKPIHDNQYIDWRYTNGATTGTLQFGPLINMRCAWQFRYFTTTSANTYPKFGESAMVKFVLGNAEPTAVSVASTTSPNEMRASWVSAKVQSPTVWYGTAANSLTKSVAASGESYTASDMCHAPATIVSAQYFRDPGVMYSAVLTGLTPDQTYYYKVGDASSSTTSKVFKLRTPPAPGKKPASNNGVMSFFMYGDLGDWNIHATGARPDKRTAATLQLVRRDMSDSRYNFVATMHDGDLSYAMGRTYLWDQFGAMIEPVASEIPYMVGIGNHEYCHTSGGDKDPSGAPGNGYHPPEGNYGADSKGECGVPTNKRYIMPSNGNRVFWWSVEYGLTHHTQVSSEHDYTPGSAMYKWLESDLEKVDRAKTPWLFLYLHRPMYTSETYESDYNVALFIRKNLEPLLAKYKVDAVFSGHYHAYELTCPVYNGMCRSEVIAGSSGRVKAMAPVHIMVGSGGADVDNTGYYNVPWRVDAAQTYGYGRVHVHNATHTQFEFVRNDAQAVTSSTWIISDHNWAV